MGRRLPLDAGVEQKMRLGIHKFSQDFCRFRETGDVAETQHFYRAIGLLRAFFCQKISVNKELRHFFAFWQSDGMNGIAFAFYLQ
jgi:hypothetical protein